ncbi:MAG: formate dehydrogenase accessory sulfurtransferase FdhD [Desulfobacteraceae bacterium]|nr:formate dehydrogenase accessory sulfurtransferase FdhD [Desulfobacteraceae bacterium]
MRKEPPSMQVVRHKTARLRENGLHAVECDLAVEELLEIFIDDAPYAVTMRLPGNDINLAAGFCFSEGIISSLDDLLSISHCETAPDNGKVLVYIDPRRARNAAARIKRPEFLSKSSCGLCGKSRAEEIYTEIKPVERFRPMSLGAVLSLKDHLESRQSVFRKTGCTHSALIFDTRGGVLSFAEDIGRHNAFDKAIGELLLERKLADAYIALVSSRLSFEMVQKAGVLGAEIIAGFSAPTSMAVKMAEYLHITLIGFLRENSLSIYTHPGRITNDRDNS